MSNEENSKNQEQAPVLTRRTAYNKKPHTKITLNIDLDALEYFQDLSKESGIPYQKLINLYLVDCARTGRRLQLSWGQKDIQTT